MNHRIWHFKRTNFDPLALVQKSCCCAVVYNPLSFYLRALCFLCHPVCVLLLAWKILLCLEFGWHVDHFSLWMTSCYCSKAKMRYNDELIRQIQKDCLHWTRPSLFIHIFSRKNTLSTPAILSSSLPSKKIFFYGIINVWSQNKVMLFFVALIFLEARGEKLL